MMLPGSIRMLVAFILFIGLALPYSDRINIASVILNERDVHNWTPNIQAAVLASFYYGYVAIQLPASLIVYRFGGKEVFLGSMIIWSLITIITPYVADNLYLLLLARVVLGAADGLALPSVHFLISALFPPKEYSRAVAIISSGTYAGTVLANYCSPYLSATFGWQSNFVFVGLTCFVWCWIWIISPVPWNLTSSKMNEEVDTPKEERGEETKEREGKRERKRGEKEKEEEKRQKREKEEEKRQKRGEKERDEEMGGCFCCPSSSSSSSTVPWGKIFRDRNVWAIIVNQFCDNWGFDVIVAFLPLYFNDSLKVAFADEGLLLSAPYLVQWIMSMLVGYLADYALECGWNAVKVRKYFQLIGMLGAGFLFPLMNLTKSPAAASLIISLALGINSCTLVGACCFHLDFAGEFSSTVFSVGNFAANITGILAVQASGLIMSHWQHAWNVVFLVSGIVYLTGAFAWVVLADGKSSLSAKSSVGK